jgi:hypothetical protein
MKHQSKLHFSNSVTSIELLELIVNHLVCEHCVSNISAKESIKI